MCRAGACSGSDAVLVRTVIGQGVRATSMVVVAKPEELEHRGVTVNGMNQANRAWVSERSDRAVGCVGR